MRIALLTIFSLLSMVTLNDASEVQWWQKWSNFPKVLRIQADQIQHIFNAKEKLVFIYCGYEVDEIVCGSQFIPYTLVPPNADGSRVNLSRLPKDAWIMCY